MSNTSRVYKFAKESLFQSRKIEVQRSRKIFCLFTKLSKLTTQQGELSTFHVGNAFTERLIPADFALIQEQFLFLLQPGEMLK